MGKENRSIVTNSFKEIIKSHQNGKSPKTGAYTFVESIMAPELVDEFLKKK
jgi:hypothetical protein